MTSDSVNGSRVVATSGSAAARGGARTRRTVTLSRPGRRGVLGSLVDEATVLLQSVVSEVAPAVVDSLDVDRVVQRVDVQAILDRVDLNELVDRIDIDSLIDRVDIMRVLAGLDLASIMVLANGIIAQVDVNTLVSHLDVDLIIDKVDVNALLAKIDVNQLIERTDLGPIIAHSGAGVVTEAVDAVRSGGVGLDSFVHRWADKALGRGGTSPGGPGRLVERQEDVP